MSDDTLAADGSTGGGRLRVLVVGPSMDGNDLGEVEWAVNWSRAMARRADVTVLSSSRIDAVPLARQLPEARVVTWPEPAVLYRRFERFNAMAKPALPLFSYQVRKWVRSVQAQGERFDIAHQILPQGMRHTTPLHGLGIPYVIGPLGGGLQTPEAFRSEVQKGVSIASRLRAFDILRLRYDPLLRASYGGAAAIIGVAPYVKDILAGHAKIPIRQFEAMMERGYSGVAPQHERHSEVGRLALLHVGRAVRTKGLRDVVRAMALLRDLPGVTLTSAGAGPDLAACKAEAEALGVADRVTFLDRIPREEVERLYETSDVFCFPSFREPMGGVFFEAMAHGLPVITAALGGPDFIVDDSCGMRLPVQTPDQFAKAIADAVRALAMDPARRLALGAGSQARLKSFGDWDDKAAATMDLYRDVLARAAETAR